MNSVSKIIIISLGSNKRKGFQFKQTFKFSSHTAKYTTLNWPIIAKYMHYLRCVLMESMLPCLEIPLHQKYAQTATVTLVYPTWRKKLRPMHWSNNTPKATLQYLLVTFNGIWRFICFNYKAIWTLQRLEIKKARLIYVIHQYQTVSWYYRGHLFACLFSLNCFVWDEVAFEEWFASVN